MAIVIVLILMIAGSVLFHLFNPAGLPSAILASDLLYSKLDRTARER